MSTLEIILTITNTLFGGGAVLTTVLFFRAEKRLKMANVRSAEVDAETKDWELEEKRIKNLHDSIEHNNKTIDTLTKLVDSLTSRLSVANGSIDKHIDRNREIANRLYESESETNRVNMQLDEANKRIISLTEARDHERSAKEYFKHWRCERPDCRDPRGRKPPNTRLLQETYADPETRGDGEDTTEAAAEKETGKEAGTDTETETE